MTDIHVFAQHCFYSESSKNKGNVRPKGYSGDIAYKNLKRTSEKYNLDVTYMLDIKYRNGNKHSIENDSNNKIIEHIGGTNAISFTNILNYISGLKLDRESIIYLVEDDYFHLDDWPIVLLDAFDIPQVDFVTLYDHNDKYGMLPMYDTLMSKIYCGNQSHWRVTPSTTNTYAMRFMTLLNTLDIHYKYSNPELGWTRDAAKFQELCSTGRILVSPMPGWSTHLENPYMSPLIDWEELIEKENEYAKK